MSKGRNQIEQSDNPITQNPNYNKYINIYYKKNFLTSGSKVLRGEEIDDLPAQVFAIKCCAVLHAANEIWPEKEMAEKEVVEFVENDLKNSSVCSSGSIINKLYNAILTYPGIESEVMDKIKEDIGILGDESFLNSIAGE